jgi:putative ABC transport system permease protein
VKCLPLLWAGLWRKPIGTVLTVLSIAVAFLLFGVLHGVMTAFTDVQSKLSETRLRVTKRANILEPMPINMDRSEN